MAFKPPASRSISKVCHSFHCLDAVAVNRKMKYLEVIFLTSMHREMLETEKEYWTKTRLIFQVKSECFEPNVKAAPPVHLRRQTAAHAP